jgi:hypothetical protein
MRNRTRIVTEHGERLWRTFLLLFAVVAATMGRRSHSATAYRVLLELPADTDGAFYTTRHAAAPIGPAAFCAWPGTVFSAESGTAEPHDRELTLMREGSDAHRLPRTMVNSRSASLFGTSSPAITPRSAQQARGRPPPASRAGHRVEVNSGSAAGSGAGISGPKKRVCGVFR